MAPTSRVLRVHKKSWNNIGYMEGKVQKWQREGAMCHIDVACRLYTNPTTANTW